MDNFITLSWIIITKDKVDCWNSVFVEANSQKTADKATRDKYIHARGHSFS